MQSHLDFAGQESRASARARLKTPEELHPSPKTAGKEVRGEKPREKEFVTWEHNRKTKLKARSLERVL